MLYHFLILLWELSSDGEENSDFDPLEELDDEN